MGDDVKAQFCQRLSNGGGTAEGGIIGVFGWVVNINGLLIDAGNIGGLDIFGHDFVKGEKIVSTIGEMPVFHDGVVHQIITNGHQSNCGDGDLRLRRLR